MGGTVSLPGRRAKAVDAFAVGAGSFFPDVSSRNNARGEGRKGVRFDSGTLVMLKTQRTHFN